MSKKRKRFELTLETIDERIGKPIGEIIDVIETDKERTAKSTENQEVTTA
jgi:hypothetical protein